MDSAIGMFHFSSDLSASASPASDMLDFSEFLEDDIDIGSDYDPHPSFTTVSAITKSKKKRRGTARTRSCQQCRNRKVKCSRTGPCSSCIMRKEECTWAGNAKPLPTPDTAKETRETKAEIDRLNVVVSLLLERINMLERPTSNGLPHTLPLPQGTSDLASSSSATSNSASPSPIPAALPSPPLAAQNLPSPFFHNPQSYTSNAASYFAPNIHFPFMYSPHHLFATQPTYQ